MYIYAEKITPRLEYIVNTLFAGTRFTLTASPADFSRYEGPKINYSPKKFTDKEILVRPNGLLHEQGVIKKQAVSCTEWNGLTIFFQSNGDIPFDIFSAAFYLLSRYEEYLPHREDAYGRFSHEESLAYKEHFLHLPLVNLWMQEFNKLLRRKDTRFELRETAFSFIPTYDIDIAYAHNGTGVLQKIARKLKGMKTVADGKDIFDVYEWLDELHAAHRLSPVYFFLLAKRRSRYDKNISVRSAALKRLIKETAAKYTVGIHPSWQSYHDEEALQREIMTLQKVSAKKISVSRQHYIRFTLPYTYRNLIKTEITDDFSMGYGSINGFRASFASPFYWYDLPNETTTALRLHPFCYMDANAFYEEKLSPGQAFESLQHYYDAVKKVNGELVTIFHNHFLTEEPRWQPWRTLYADFLRENC